MCQFLQKRWRVEVRVWSAHKTANQCLVLNNVMSAVGEIETAYQMEHDLLQE